MAIFFSRTGEKCGFVYWGRSLSGGVVGGVEGEGNEEVDRDVFSCAKINLHVDLKVL